MKKIILFYKYISIDDPHSILKWQKSLCQSLGLKGRVIIAHEGINGTLGGTQSAIEYYKNNVLVHKLFADIDFKESLDTQDHFPKLRIVIKNEIVHLGLPPEMAPASQAGTYLNPNEAHALIAQKPKDLLIIDCRNTAESEIGHIEGAIRPSINYFREFPSYIDKNLELLKNKKVIMYCTGGIRCERASAYIKSKGIGSWFPTFARASATELASR